MPYRLATRRLVTAAVLCAALSSLVIQSTTAQSTPAIAVEGDHYTIDGAPMFLIFASYFDAMHASTSAWANDLDYLKQHGLKGVRVLPNWYSGYCASSGVNVRATDTLIQYDGSVHAGTLAKLKDFLVAAARREMVVDVTFTRETVAVPAGQPDPMPYANYKTAVRSVTASLASSRNVVFDVQNEWNKGYLSPNEVQDLIANVRAVDPQRIVGASRAENEPSATGTDARNWGFNHVPYHDDRTVGTWYTHASIGMQIDSVQAALQSAKPLYFQEPIPWDRAPGCSNHQQDPTPGRARQAVASAKFHGAAAWTFHTRSTFSLANTSFLNRLNADPNQKAELEALAGAAAGETWGVAAYSVSPTAVSVGPQAGASEFTLTRLAGSTGEWQASSSEPWLHLGASRGLGLSISYTYDENTSAQQRTATVTVSGRTATVTQSAAPPFAEAGTSRIDLLWKSSSGQLATWRMSGITRAASTWLTPQVVNQGWELGAAGDFDGDTDIDLVWQRTDGVIALWYMQQNQLTAGVSFSIPGPSDPDWRVKAAGNMDNDGDLDLLLQHRTTNHVAVWILQGTRVEQSKLLTPEQVNAGWELKGTGRFNADGETDLLWQNGTNLTVWLMNDTTLSSGLGFDTAPGPGWNAAAVRDMNGDSVPDILWQRPSDGALSSWLLRYSAAGNVLQVIGGGIDPGSAPPAWMMIGPR